MPISKTTILSYVHYENMNRYSHYEKQDDLMRIGVLSYVIQVTNYEKNKIKLNEKLLSCM